MTLIDSSLCAWVRRVELLVDVTHQTASKSVKRCCMVLGHSCPVVYRYSHGTWDMVNARPSEKVLINLKTVQDNLSYFKVLISEFDLFLQIRITATKPLYTGKLLMPIRKSHPPWGPFSIGRKHPFQHTQVLTLRLCCLPRLPTAEAPAGTIHGLTAS